jgi:ATP-binding cassette subfamily B protein
LLLALIVFIFPYSKITEVAIILALVELIQRSINPIKGIAGKITNIQRAVTGLSRIRDFVDTLESYQTTEKKVVIPTINFAGLEVDIKSFQYPEAQNGDVKRTKFALKDIHFKAYGGQLIGIVGLSGSGKSTLLNIISANILPDHGSVSILEDKGVYAQIPSNLEKYREQVGIVSQDSHIFSESLEFNITLQNSQTSDFPEFWNWVNSKIDYLKSWSLSPQDQINPELISPGQKQLLSAIRSCYLKKTIVLFDEISSTLDSDLEMALREVVLLIQKKSLAIIVAHRLETIKDANAIIVMEGGRIIDCGPHNELMNFSQKYKKFIDQLSH